MPLLVQFLLEPLSLAARLLGLLQDRPEFRPEAVAFLVPVGQLGPSLVALGAEGRKLVLQIGLLGRVRGGLPGRAGDFRIPVKPVEEVAFRTLGTRWPGGFHDVLDQELVAAHLALDVMTGIVLPDAQGHRAGGANHGNAVGLGFAEVRVPRRELFGGRRRL